MNETWKEIPEYRGYYEASDKGRIKSTRNNKILAQTVQNNGYMMVSLSVGGVHKMRTVHRLIAGAFLENPNNYRDVNHIDGNKTNNNLQNLEWVTHSENIKHAYSVAGHPRRTAAVVCIDTGKEYESIKQAAEITGINKASISHAICGISKTAGGFRWKRK